MHILRKITIVVVFMALISFTEASYASISGTVTDNGVNVRSGPSTNSRIITQVEKGQRVIITKTQSGFYHVYFPGVNDGWISTEFVNVPNSPTPVTPVAEGSMGLVTGTSVNIRSKPSKDGAVLGKAAQNETFSLLELQDGWYKISYNNTDAYISSDYIQTPIPEQPEFGQGGSEEQLETVYAIVVSDTGLYLRQKPTIKSAALSILTYGAVVDVDSVDDEWIAVTYEGVQGYVSAEYVRVERGVKPITKTEAINPLAYAIIEYGKQFLGTPYAYGGTNLKKGVDCSGFVYMVMKEHGIHLNRSSYTMVKNGVTVQRSQLQPGDLVFFATSGTGRISHVGIYIGNKRFIHSSSSRSNWGVTISSLDEPTYNRQYITANRVL